MKFFLAATAILASTASAADCTAEQVTANSACMMKGGLLGGNQTTCEGVATGADECAWCPGVLGGLDDLCKLKAECDYPDATDATKKESTKCSATGGDTGCTAGAIACSLGGSAGEDACKAVATHACKWCMVGTQGICHFAPASPCEVTSDDGTKIKYDGNCPAVSGVSALAPAALAALAAPVLLMLQ